MRTLTCSSAIHVSTDVHTVPSLSQCQSGKWNKGRHSFGSGYDRYVRLSFIGTFLLSVLAMANWTMRVGFGRIGATEPVAELA